MNEVKHPTVCLIGFCISFSMDYTIMSFACFSIGFLKVIILGSLSMHTCIHACIFLYMSHFYGCVCTLCVHNQCFFGTKITIFPMYFVGLVICF